MTTPQATQRPARKILGPMNRMRIVAGGWNRVYVMKNTSATVDCEVPS